jgi:hypothetical protein
MPPTPLDPKILAALGLSALIACDDGKGTLGPCLDYAETDTDRLGPCLEIDTLACLDSEITDTEETDTLGPCLDIAPDTDETDTDTDEPDTDTDTDETDTDTNVPPDTDDTDLGPCLDIAPDTDTDLSPCLSLPPDTDLSARSTPPRPRPPINPPTAHLARLTLLRDLIAQGILPPDLAPPEDPEEP